MFLPEKLVETPCQ